MIKKKILFLSIQLWIMVVTGYGQTNIVKTWYFGDSAGIDFKSGSAVELTDGQLRTLEGCTVVSDRYTGNLLFYGQGDKIWNYDHELVKNGSGLFGHSSSTQAVLAIPQPGNDSIYYIFTTDGHGGVPNYPAESHGLGTFAYSILNMNSDSGRGEITIKNKVLFTITTEKLTAVHHCNKEDIWVLGHKLNSNEFYAYLVTRDGLNTTPVKSSIGSEHAFDKDNNNISGYLGYMKFSPNGKKVAVAIREINTEKEGIVEIFDFDNAAGKLSSPVQIRRLKGAYGLSFSSSGQFLYVSCHTADTTQIVQFDLSIWDSLYIDTNRHVVFEVLSSSIYLGALQMGSDGKIYAARNGPKIGVIQEPELKGSLCNYNHNGFAFTGSRESIWGLPNYIESYFNATSSQYGFSYEGVCKGDTTFFKDLSGVVSGSWYWDFGDTASGNENYASTPQPFHLYSVPGYYRIQLIVDDGRCSPDTTIKGIWIYANRSYQLPDALGCRGESIAIGFTPTDSGLYDWTPGQFVSDSTMSKTFALPQDTGIYLRLIAIEKNCQDTIYQKVEWVDEIKLNAGKDTGLCPWSVYELGDSLNPALFSYTWTPDEFLSSSNGSTPLFTGYDQDTTFSYVLNSNSAIQCLIPDTVTITVLPYPTVNAGEDFMAIKDKDIQLDGQVQESSEYFWSPTELFSNPYVLNPYIDHNKIDDVIDTLLVALNAVSEQGCLNTDTLRIVFIDHAVLEGPGAFSPNNDQVNDFWEPVMVGILEITYLDIHNRWGEKVFQSSGTSIQWDGRLKGEILEMGAYIYHIEAIALDNSILERSGKIVLIR